MTREQKNKAKKKVWIYLVALVVYIVACILYFNNPDDMFKFEQENVLHRIIAMGVVGLIICGFFVLFIMSQIYLHSLEDYRKDLKNSRNLYHVKLYWELLMGGEYDKAILIFNHPNLIKGEFRTLCNGILIGLSTQIKELDLKWEETPEERMKRYLKDID